MTDRLYPVLLQLKNRTCVIIGGGGVAERKAMTLLQTGASVVVVSPELTERLQDLAQAGRIVWRKKAFTPEDVHGAFLIFAATNHPEVNLAVYEAKESGQLLNISDRPDLSTFTVPAQLHRGKLLLTVSTEGASPGLSRKLIEELAERYDEAYEIYLDFLAETRRLILEQVENPKRRRRLFRELLADEFLLDARRKDTDRLWERFMKLMREEGEEDT
ncbi:MULTISPECIES: precorrin-2 dehydrogenase/sirohydrochlorin ferrochelatase family protein [Aneurinibacillus]|uniref:precorrin-2 dehydrogenase n=1 Tax=Aneurinibacillus danicus TaxID=267746 RepID=A0A511V3I4_9BACL|nr:MULTISPECIES: NAD(P)-dependent oxidoreductase [Aneurinibacillus]GEN33409.1 precorrin-2 dehydrogenase [Aneurinibacillus danicus]